MASPTDREVVDASIAVEWFAPSDDRRGRAALVVLDEVQQGPNRFFVPDLFYYEVHAVLCRKLSSAAQVGDALDHLWGLGLRCVALDPGVARRAGAVAFRWGVSGYDAIYLALAEAIGGMWVTFDGKAHRRAASLGRSRVPPT